MVICTWSIFNNSLCRWGEGCYRGSKHNVFNLQILSKSEQWWLRKSILSLHYLGSSTTTTTTTQENSSSLGLVEIYVGLASWGLARLTSVVTQPKMQIGATIFALKSEQNRCKMVIK